VDNFIFVSNDYFAELVKKNVEQINYFYPKSKIWVYDLTDEEKDLSKIKKIENVNYFHWPKERWDLIEWIEKVKDIKDLSSSRNLSLKQKLAKLKNRVLGKIPNKKLQLLEAKRFHRIVTQRILCIKDCLNRSEGSVTFLDSDAFIVKRFDFDNDNDWDIGVTLRRNYELDYKFNNCNLLNDGVVIFKGNKKCTLRFVSDWIEKIRTNREVWSDQTALSRLILDWNSNAFTEFNKIILSNMYDCKVKVLECEYYNFTWIEEGIDLSKVYVAHFKGGRYLKMGMKSIDKILLKAREING